MFKIRECLLRITICGAFLVGGAMILIWPAKAHINSPVFKPPVCACCSEEGDWYERTGRVDSAQLFQLDRMRFSPTANTFMSPAEDYEFSSSYSLSQTRAGRRWQLKLRDDKGKTGTISFMIPATLTSYGTDLHEQSEPGGLGPLLYKEMRLAGAAQVTGILKQGINGPARFRLILQGRGRGCTEAEDFKNWTLQITGARVSHAFYGSLDKPE